MNFLLDESAEFRLAALLQQHGHYVKAIAHDYPSGLPDRQVLAIAKNEQRILITNDRDFGELIFRQRMPHAGVILFRLCLSTENRTTAITENRPTPISFLRKYLLPVRLQASWLSVLAGPTET